MTSPFAKSLAEGFKQTAEQERKEKREILEYLWKLQDEKEGA